MVVFRDFKRGRVRQTVLVIDGAVFFGIESPIGLGNVVPEGFKPSRPSIGEGAHLQHRPDSGQGAFIGGQDRVIRRKLPWVIGGVSVTKQNGIAAAGSNFLCPVGESRIERRTIGARAMILKVHASMQAGSGRPAWHGVRIVAFE